MSAAHRTLLGAAATLLLVAPLAATASVASWTDGESVHANVGTSSFDCDAASPTSGFAATASGRFLSGSLLGTALDPIADLERMMVTTDGITVAPSPADAIDLGAAEPYHAYANPFEVGVLGIVGVDLTGLAVPLPGAALGALNQYAAVSAEGDAAGASGLVNDSGAVLVDEDTPSADLPGPATISLTELLPATAGVSAAELQVGAVGASSVLDGCAALRSSIWGDGSVIGSVRDYGIAGLGLQIDSPLAAGLVGTVNTGAASVQAAVNGLLGPSGLIASSLGARLDLALPAVLTTTVGGTVTLAGLDLAGSVSALLTTPLSDGVVTIDLQSGAITVDLGELLPPLNDAAPNTEIVLSAAVLSPITARVGALLSAWTTQITETLRAELSDAQLTIDLNAIVRTPGVPFLAPNGLDIVRATIGFNGTIGQLLAPGATLSVQAEVLGSVALVSQVLGALGLPSVAQIISTITGLGAVLASAAAASVASTVLPAITSLGDTLVATSGAVVTALGEVVSALPRVLSIMVNVQPDQPGAPSSGLPSFVPDAPGATAEYIVSALRIGLADALGPGPAAHVLFGSASAGPVTAPR